MDNEEELTTTMEGIRQRVFDAIGEIEIEGHIVLGVLAQIIVEVSAVAGKHIGKDAADKEFYSLINAMEAAYAEVSEAAAKGALQ